jgi:hypothetical protein
MFYIICRPVNCIINMQSLNPDDLYFYKILPNIAANAYFKFLFAIFFTV